MNSLRKARVEFHVFTMQSEISTDPKDQNEIHMMINHDEGNWSVVNDRGVNQNISCDKEHDKDDLNYWDLLAEATKFCHERLAEEKRRLSLIETKQKLAASRKTK